MLADLKSILEAALHERIVGDIFHSRIVRTESGRMFFLKKGINSRTYRCEANGLNELAKANAICVARVAAVGDDFILTEYIEGKREKSEFFEEFGRNFAQLHRYKSSTYGFYEDNFIGANPQPNIPEKDEQNDWIAFYFNKRLLYQYRLAEQNGLASQRLKAGFSKLEKRIEKILKNNEEVPTLLHGDLWSGNFLFDKSGNAVLIDPAAYYGHREVDLAMTKLFGGFAPQFYQAYIAEYPLKEGWQYRENIYKLYHVLNHLNIFGHSYLTDAEEIIYNYIK
ncbi:MAG: fructosamine kinase family protein [Bacteroidales bacterium]|jgi:fructosamine-3-kinase|nr:fructosamine kinase family protein [Bacteroidales bacterium]